MSFSPSSGLLLVYTTADPVLKLWELTTSRRPYLFLITVNVVQSLQSSMVYSSGFLLVYKGRDWHIPQSACPAVAACLCLSADKCNLLSVLLIWLTLAQTLLASLFLTRTGRRRHITILWPNVCLSISICLSVSLPKLCWNEKKPTYRTVYLSGFFFVCLLPSLSMYLSLCRCLFVCVSLPVCKLCENQQGGWYPHGLWWTSPEILEPWRRRHKPTDNSMITRSQTLHLTLLPRTTSIKHCEGGCFRMVVSVYLSAHLLVQHSKT